MPTNDSNTHGIIRHAELPTNNFSIQPIGDPIIFPADGPWIIYGIYSGAIRVDKSYSCDMIYTIMLSSLSGDISPASAPLAFPGMGYSNAQEVPTVATDRELHIYPTKIIVPGKSSIQLSARIHSDTVSTTHIMTGVLFAHTPPQPSPITNSAWYQTYNTPPPEHQIGTLKLSESQSLITGLCSFAVSKHFTLGASPALYYYRLDSPDTKIQPCYIPGQSIIDCIPLTHTIQGPSGQFPYIPLNIQLKPGSTINIYFGNYASAQGRLYINTYLSYE